MSLHWHDSRVEVHRLVVGPVDNNVFVIRCRETGEAVLIDAANEHERLLELCQRLGVRTVLETHGHWDHIQAVEAVRDAGYDVGVGAADAAMLPSYDFILDDEAVIEIGNLRVRTHHTPGHTPGSLSFSIDDAPLLFSGDTLFPGGPGATHFEGGDFDTIMESLENRMFRAFDADTMVLPGHGADTTLATEAPHLDDWYARGW